MTAPSPHPPAPDTTGELREAIRDELGGWPLGGGYYQYTVGSDEAGDMADAILALPALRDLLAERDTLAAKVRAVEELDGRYDKPSGPWVHVAAIRRALGTPTTRGGE